MKQDWLCKYKRNIEAHSRIISCRGKVIRSKYSECVFVALNFRHAMRNVRITFDVVLTVHRR